MSSSTGQLQGQMAGGETLEVTSPGLIAECGKSGDGAAAGAGRFQWWFVGVVGVFLLVTGGLKLVSVLQESRVLGAADPLLSLLTVREVLFLAAVLELGVAALLLRHRAARWAPELILWLVILFEAYRLSLWAIGFQGHCSCLGHLFDWLPWLKPWSDWLMQSSLLGMAAGCLWLLYGYYCKGYKGKHRAHNS